MESKTYKIIRHKNPKGKTTWYRAVYYDEKGQVHKSSVYGGSNLNARRRAQAWLYANIHVWCKIAHVEQRIVDENGNSQVTFLYTEEIV